MPFIRGRYHINPLAGQALEAARAADEALSQLEQDAHGALANSADAENPAGSADDDAEFTKIPQNAGPIHRVEIEAAELVPAHSGRAQRGFVAHLHRELPAEVPAAAGNPASAALSAAYSNGVAPRGPASPGEYPARAYAPRPETHVFADHRDLVNFLRDQFAKDCPK